MIKTFLTIEGRGLLEQVFGNGTADGVPSRIAESPISSSRASEAGRNDTGDGVPAAEASDANPEAKRGQTVSAEEPATKWQRIDEHGAESTGTATATEESVLALVASCNGVMY
jgi:ATP-dependent DNA helicase RecQ